MNRTWASVGSNVRKLTIFMIDGPANWQVFMSVVVGLLAALCMALVAVLSNYVLPILPDTVGAVLVSAFILPPFIVFAVCMFLAYDVVWSAFGAYRFMGWEDRAIARILLRRLGAWDGQFREHM